MEGILKRRGAENAEEVFQKELCGLCDSAFPILQNSRSSQPNQTGSAEQDSLSGE